MAKRKNIKCVCVSNFFRDGELIMKGEVYELDEEAYQQLVVEEEWMEEVKPKRTLRTKVKMNSAQRL